MNKSEHTPGPWGVVKLYVVGPSGQIIPHDGACLRVFSDAKYIAVVGESGDREEEIEADARLIAAAPNLLAACRGLLTFAVPLDPEAVEHVYAARRAIEMATTNH